MIGFVTICAFTAVMAASAAVDLHTKKIPDQLVRLVWCIAVLSFFTLPTLGGIEKLWGILAAGAPLYLCALLFPGKLGGGDCKLMTACGLFLGADRVLEALFVSLFAAAVTGIVLYLHVPHKNGEGFRNFRAYRALPLGPFLALGSCISCRDLFVKIL